MTWKTEYRILFRVTESLTCLVDDLSDQNPRCNRKSRCSEDSSNHDMGAQKTPLVDPFHGPEASRSPQDTIHYCRKPHCHSRGYSSNLQSQRVFQIITVRNTPTKFHRYNPLNCLVRPDCRYPRSSCNDTEKDLPVDIDKSEGAMEPSKT